MICCGVDAGSRTIKIVVLDNRQNKVLASGFIDQGIRQGELASDLLDRILEPAGLHRRDMARTVATGYGRNAVDFADKTITEITCHARGVLHYLPGTRTVIDIGGQDSKLIRMEAGGRVRDFILNDRCAAGTGRFLEVVSSRLAVPLDKLGDLAQQADTPCSISSMCVVFAETEIIGLLSGGEKPANIAAGVQTSIASRLVSMAGGKVDEPVVFTGGVALIPGMSRALETAIGHPVSLAPDPRMTGALGAAILAADNPGASL